MKRLFLFLLIALISMSGCQSSSEGVKINVDFSNTVGPMQPAWAWFGYDEPNYTYMEYGKELLTELSDLSPVPVHVRAHNLLNTGKGVHALKWGSTNAYTEDKNGKPVYDWTIVDWIFDTYVDRDMKPLVEIGFMPKALSVKPEPYQHSWRPGAPYSDIYTGWAYPPKDYGKWAELVYQWVRHSVDRYGKAEVESWYWELWNEPNIGYWQGTTEEYIKLYDYTAGAIKRALPTATMGGPHSTGPSWDQAEKFLRTFLDHIVSGKNYVTGEIGAPLDFIAFHAKGRPVLRDSTILMNMGTQLRDISKGFEVVTSYPQLKDTPIILGESDPEGCAACSQQDYPENAYRNGTMYSSYTAASFPRVYRLADHFGVNLRGIVSWSFEFEGQPIFNGYRSLATNGIDKPVLNIFRMFGKMSGNRVKVTGDLAYNYTTVRDSSVRGKARDINAMATLSDTSAAVLVWNYHDLNVITPDTTVNVNFNNIPVKNATLYEYRVDQHHSNAYEIWKQMGSPKNPSEAQYEKLDQSDGLELNGSPEEVSIRSGKFTKSIQLPGQGVSLLLLKWD